ncbi:MAG: hypothetical protein ACOCZ5_01720 [bacterium]
MITKIVVLNLDREVMDVNKDYYVQSVWWSCENMFKESFPTTKGEIRDVFNNLLDRGFTLNIVGLIYYTIINIHHNNLTSHIQRNVELYPSINFDSMLILSGKGFPLMRDLIMKEIKI